MLHEEYFNSFPQKTYMNCFCIHFYNLLNLTSTSIYGWVVSALILLSNFRKLRNIGHLSEKSRPCHGVRVIRITIMLVNEPMNCEKCWHKAYWTVRFDENILRKKHTDEETRIFCQSHLTWFRFFEV